MLVPHLLDLFYFFLDPIRVQTNSYVDAGYIFLRTTDSPRNNSSLVKLIFEPWNWAHQRGSSISGAGIDSFQSPGANIRIVQSERCTKMGTSQKCFAFLPRNYWNFDFLQYRLVAWCTKIHFAPTGCEAIFIVKSFVLWWHAYELNMFVGYEIVFQDEQRQIEKQKLPVEIRMQNYSLDSLFL